MNRQQRKERQMLALEAMCKAQRLPYDVYAAYNAPKHLTKVRYLRKDLNKVPAPPFLLVGLSLQHGCFYAAVPWSHDAVLQQRHELREVGLLVTCRLIQYRANVLEVRAFVTKPFSRKGRDTLKYAIDGMFVFVPPVVHPDSYKAMDKVGLGFGRFHEEFVELVADR